MSLLALRLVLSAGPYLLQQARLASCNNNKVMSPLGAAHALVGNGDKRSTNDLFRRASIAICLANLLKNSPVVNRELNETTWTTGEPTKQLLGSAEEKQPVKMTKADGSSQPYMEGLSISPEEKLEELTCGLLHYLQSLPCNAHEISEQVTTAEGRTEIREIGAGVYPTVSLMNHSCDPNVLRISYGNSCVVRVIRPIEKGEEILDNYGFHYAVQSRERRQSSLSCQYYFSCRCQACSEDWPTHEELPDDERFKCQLCTAASKFCPHCPDPEKVQKYLHSTESYVDISNRLESHNSGESIKKAMEHLTVLDQVLVRPSREYNRCQENIKFAFISAGNREYRELPQPEKNEHHGTEDALKEGNCILRIYGRDAAMKCQ